MVGPLQTVDASVEPPQDECGVSMDTVAMAALSNGSFDECISHSFDFSHRGLLSTVMETPDPSQPVSLERVEGPSHSIKPLKKRRLGTYVADTTDEKEEQAEATMGASTVAAAHNNVQVRPLLTAVASRNLGARGAIAGDRVDRRTDIDTTGASQKQRAPNTSIGAQHPLQATKAHASASVNVTQVNRMGGGVRLRGISGRSSHLGLTTSRGNQSSNTGAECPVRKTEPSLPAIAGSDGRHSAPDALRTRRPGSSGPAAPSKGVYCDSKLQARASCAKRSTSTSPLRGPSPVDGRAGHLKGIDGKPPEVKLKLKLKPNNKAGEVESSNTRTSKDDHSPQEQAPQPVPKAEKTFPALKKKAAWRQTYGAKHEMIAGVGAKITEVTPNFEHYPPGNFRKSGEQNQGNKDKNVCGGGGGGGLESENKAPDPLVIMVSTAAPASRAMAESERGSVEKLFSAGFRKQRKEIGKRMRDTTRVGSTKAKLGLKESGEVEPERGLGKGMKVHSSSGRVGDGDAAAIAISITNSSRISSGDSDNNAEEEGKAEHRFDDLGEDEGDVEFSLDDLTYYPAQFEDDGRDGREQHDSDNDAVEEGVDVRSEREVVGNAENEEENNGLRTVDTNARDGSGMEERETQRRSTVPDNGLDAQRRSRKRKRLGKLFVSEDDEDEGDPEFMPSKKLRCAVRRMRAQQEQEQATQQQRQRRSGGGGRTGHDIMDGDDIGRDET